MYQAGQANTNTSKLKTLRKALLSIVVLIVLFVLAGVGYALLSSQDTSKPDTKALSQASAEIEVAKPTEPGPNAPESAALYLAIPSVKAGSNALATGKTNPKSNCTIEVSYNGVASKDSGLTPKIADPYGGVSWTWTVEPTAAPGVWPVKMTCVWHGKTAVVVTNMQVTK